MLYDTNGFMTRHKLIVGVGWVFDSSQACRAAHSRLTVCSIAVKITRSVFAVLLQFVLASATLAAHKSALHQFAHKSQRKCKARLSQSVVSVTPVQSSM